MTPARKAALQWFYNIENDTAISATLAHPNDKPTHCMILVMLKCGQLKQVRTWSGCSCKLTDAGRRALHEVVMKEK